MKETALKQNTFGIPTSQTSLSSGKQKATVLQWEKNIWTEFSTHLAKHNFGGFFVRGSNDGQTGMTEPNFHD